MIIKRKVNGQETVIFSTPINKGCERKWELQGDDYITLRFSLAQPIVFKIGDYTDTTVDEGGANGRYYITSSVKPSYNKSTGAYEYDIKLEAEYKIWNNYVMKYKTSTSEVSWKLTDILSCHLEQLLLNLESSGLDTCWNGKKYTYSIDWESYDTNGHALSGVVSTEAKLVEYSNTKICDALDAMADAWECEWWVQDNVIYFGYCENQGPSTEELELGVNVESWDISDSSGTHANRVYAFGSTRNIPSNYRRSLIIKPFSILENTYTEFYNDLVQLSKKQINIVDTTVPYVASTWGTPTEQECPLDAGYDIGKKYTYKSLPVDTSYQYAGLPHHLVYEADKPKLKIWLKKKSGVDVDYDPDKGEQPPFYEDPNTFAHMVEVSVYRNGESYDLIAYKKFRSDSTKDYTIEIDIDNNITTYGKVVLFDVIVQIANLQGSEAEITAIGYPNINKQELSAYPFTCKLVDENYKDAGDIVVYTTFEGMDVPGTDATKNEQLDYMYDQQKRGNYYIMGVDMVGKYRILIPKSSYKEELVPLSWYTDDVSGTLYAIGDRRLMLPEGTAYVQSSGISEAEIVEEVVNFDDIYPRMKDLTIGEILCHTEDGQQTTYEDGSVGEEKYGAYYFKDSHEIATSKPYITTDDILSGQTLKVRFSSGMLNGMEFEIKLNQDFADENGYHQGYAKIIRNKDYGVSLPNYNMFPQNGDKIIYIGWDAAKIGETGLVDEAETELMAKAKEYLAKARIDDRTYTATLMEYGTFGTQGLLDSLGRQIQDSNLQDIYVMEHKKQSVDFCNAVMKKGHVVKIIDKTASVYDPTSGKEVNYRASRVIGFTHPLDIPYDHPQIVCGVSGIYSRLADIENKLRKTKS